MSDGCIAAAERKAGMPGELWSSIDVIIIIIMYACIYRLVLEIDGKTV